jgi:hypothetical protein
MLHLFSEMILALALLGPFYCGYYYFRFRDDLKEFEVKIIKHHKMMEESWRQVMDSFEKSETFQESSFSQVNFELQVLHFVDPTYGIFTSAAISFPPSFFTPSISSNILAYSHHSKNFSHILAGLIVTASKNPGEIFLDKESFEILKDEYEETEGQFQTILRSISKYRIPKVLS